MKSRFQESRTPDKLVSVTIPHGTNGRPRSRSTLVPVASVQIALNTKPETAGNMTNGFSLTPRSTSIRMNFTGSGKSDHRTDGDTANG